MNQRKLGSIISYVQMALGVIVSLIYTPYMIKILGQSEYGLYNTVASTISMMSVLSLGFNSSYIRYYSRYKEEQDTDSIYKLNGLFVLIFSVIGMIALICGLYISGHLEIVFKDGLTASEYTLARKLLILLTVNLAISFPMSVFADIISAHEQFIFLKLLGIVKTVCSPLLTIPLLFAGYRSVAIVTITIVLALFTDTMYLIFVIGHLKERFVFRGFKRGLFREIFSYTSFIAINIVVAFLPAAVLGVIFADMIERLLFNAVTVATALDVGGLIIFWIENLHAKRSYAPRVQTMDDMTIKDAFLVGCMQCIAMIPGTSRSGSTIIGGLVLGLSRKAATEFSFFLAIPTIFGATVYSFGKTFLRVSNEHSFVWTSDMTWGFSIGFVVSFISALIVVKWLLRYVSSNDFKPFGWYRIIFGVVILGTHFSGLVQW